MVNKKGNSDSSEICPHGVVAKVGWILCSAVDQNSLSWYLINVHKELNVFGTFFLSSDGITMLLHKELFSAFVIEVRGMLMNRQGMLSG